MVAIILWGPPALPWQRWEHIREGNGYFFSSSSSSSSSSSFAAHKREIDIDKEGRNIQTRERKERIIMESFTFLSYGFLKEEKRKKVFHSILWRWEKKVSRVVVISGWKEE